MGRTAAAAGAALMAAALLFRAETAAGAVRQGIALCFTSVIPALFPFFAASSLLIALGAGEAAARRLHRPFHALFRCSGAGAAAFALGLVGGYPAGARTIRAQVARRELSAAEGGQLLSFCNNAGPAFIIGIAGVTVFSSSRLGAYLYLLHALTALIVGVLLRGRGGDASAPAVLSPAVSPVRALLEAVQSAADSMGRVCAFVVFFTVVLALVEEAVGTLPPWAAGFCELTCGITRLTPDRRGFALAAGMLGWGGLSVHAQTAAVLAGSGVPMGRYLVGKALQAALSLLGAWLLWPLLT